MASWDLRLYEMLSNLSYYYSIWPKGNPGTYHYIRGRPEAPLKAQNLLSSIDNTPLEYREALLKARFSCVVAPR